MALAADEVMTGGFVRNTTTGALSVTTDTTGAVMRGGFLRDPDGRLVVSSLITEPFTWSGSGATTTVTTVPELASALAAASTGDTIELADGTYDFTAPLAVTTDGIRIKAATPKGAVLRGAPAAPASANAETTPAHILHAFEIYDVNDVFVEDIHFQWFGSGLDYDGNDDIVVQGCRFESCYGAGLTLWDCVRPRVHMCEFLDPFLAGDTTGSLTGSGSATDAQMDYAVDIYGTIGARVTHCYFFGNMNQGLSWKECNRDAYAGYNTFEGAQYTALFFGQNVPHNGPFGHSGLPNAPDSGDLVAEYNVFRPIKDAGGKVYRMNSPIRVWHVDADVVLRGNVIEAAIAGIGIEGTDGSEAGYAAGTVLIEDNVIGGAWNDAAGSPVDVASQGMIFNSGVTSVITMVNTTFANHYDGEAAAFQPNRDNSTGAAAAPTYTESGTVYLPPTAGGPLTLRTATVALDPDRSWKDALA